MPPPLPLNDPPKVVALGELLWDLFPDGPRFGGAPMNFAHHAAALGAETWVVTGIGDDDLGHAALERLVAGGLHTDHVAIVAGHPTGSVNITLDAEGKASYRFNDSEAWDHLLWTDSMAGLAARCDAVCFGTLGQRSESSRHVIRRFVTSTADVSMRVCDLNLRPPYVDESLIDCSIRMANVLKLNDEELSYLAKRYDWGDEDEAHQALRISEQFDTPVVAVTRGGRGSLMIRHGEVSDIDSEPVVVRDTVGAGDSYAAAMIHGLLAGEDLDAINRRACRVAEYVCTQSGATPALPPHLTD